MPRTREPRSQAVCSSRRERVSGFRTFSTPQIGRILPPVEPHDRALRLTTRAPKWEVGPMHPEPHLTAIAKHYPGAWPDYDAARAELTGKDDR